MVRSGDRGLQDPRGEGWSVVGTAGYRTPEVRDGVAGMWHVKSVIISEIFH